MNDVLGPIMHGPSSSHTAASYNIGCLTKMLCKDKIKEVHITFDSKSSFGRVYKSQNSEIAFLAGLIGLSVEAPNFFDSLEIAKKLGINHYFQTKDLPNADHPNYILIEISLYNGVFLTFVAKSLGGGMVLIDRLNNWNVIINGQLNNLLVEFNSNFEEEIKDIVQSRFESPKISDIQRIEQSSFIQVKDPYSFEENFIGFLSKNVEITNIWITSPIVFPIHGTPIFTNTSEMLKIATSKGFELGEIGLEYESTLLNLDKKIIIDEIKKRISVMFSSVEMGLKSKNSSMNLLEHSASKIQQEEINGNLVNPGINIKSAYRALAAMDTASSGGLICAAPTGGSCGVIASVLYTLHYDFNLSIEKIVNCALVAGVIGLVNAMNSTFAAEIAGCQVEIGIAAAMAAGAVVEAANGNPNFATNAAAIALQNTMGSVCDLVAGFCEIPCHTRNAVAASNAFICADIIMGGYINPINLDDCIKASYESGKMLPSQLRCTSLGGLAITESAKKLEEQYQEKIS
ncbi:MAG: L-serine ammonia-lyase, iron-sulfur-dependent, subunit alpha [Promethearchaeia archaeon]